MTASCDNAAQQVYTDAQGRVWEVYWIDNQYAFQNQISDANSATVTHPGWVLESKGFCRWMGTPPPRHGGEMGQDNPPPPPIQSMSSASIQGDSSGAFLLLMGLLISGGFALFQVRKNKPDFAEDYHPHDDAPNLPTVYTDENLDWIHERYKYPQYTGITEPNPFGKVSDRPAAPTAAHNSPPPPPPHPTSVPPVDTTDFPTGGVGVVETKEAFEAKWLPAPRGGYFIDEESLLSNSSQAKRIVRDAINSGVSVNFLLQYVFKISKNSRQHKLLSEIIASVEKEQR